jgi:hypothetical protein
MDATDKKFHINFWYIIAAILGMLLIQDLYLESTKLKPIPYSRFEQLLGEDKVKEVWNSQTTPRSRRRAALAGKLPGDNAAREANEEEAGR